MDGYVSEKPAAFIFRVKELIIQEFFRAKIDNAS
jgi:hypothetical protein